MTTNNNQIYLIKKERYFRVSVITPTEKKNDFTSPKRKIDKFFIFLQKVCLIFLFGRCNYVIYDETGNNIISKMMFLPNDTEIIIHELNINPKIFKAFIPKLSIFIDNIGFDEVEILI